MIVMTAHMFILVKLKDLLKPGLVNTKLLLITLIWNLILRITQLNLIMMLILINLELNIVRKTHEQENFSSFDIERYKQAKIPIMNDQQNSQCIIPNIFMSIL